MVRIGVSMVTVRDKIKVSVITWVVVGGAIQCPGIVKFCHLRVTLIVSQCSCLSYACRVSESFYHWCPYHFISFILP